MALLIPVAEKCNLNCVFCSSDAREGEYGVEAFKSLIREDSSGHVQISGGEPLLVPPLELLEVLKYCKSQRKVVEFQTNATSVERCSPKFLKALVSMVDFFNVNFSAHAPELDRKVTGIRGAFTRREEGVRRLIRVGGNVRLTHVICGLNYRFLGDFVEYVRNRLAGVGWIQFSFVKGMGRAAGNRGIVPRYRNVAPCLNRALKLALGHGLRCDVDHIPMCFLGDFTHLHVDYRKMKEGKPSVYLTEKRKIKECKGCSLGRFCPGPRRDYVALYGGLK